MDGEVSRSSNVDAFLNMNLSSTGRSFLQCRARDPQVIRVHKAICPLASLAIMPSRREPLKAEASDSTMSSRVVDVHSRAGSGSCLERHQE